MGQGSHILLINKTPYQWKKVHEHAYQMESWTGDHVFPALLGPDETRNVYVEFDEGVGVDAWDDGGEIRYEIVGVPGAFIQVRAHGKRKLAHVEFCTYVTFEGFDTTISAAGQELKLGWYHDGCQFFALVGAKQNAPMFALATNAEAPAWMKHVEGHRSLSQLTIPGTHDTGTYTWWTDQSLEKTQTLHLSRQLTCGIRFLDIRLKPSDDGNGLNVYHGISSMDLRFKEDILDACLAFLRDFPGETILMSIKQEGDDSIHAQVSKLVNATRERWYTEKDRIPTLDEARGKIVLLRRFGGDDIGLNLYDNFPDNTTKLVENNCVKFEVQDEYKSYTLFNIENKYDKYFRPVLDAARKPENADKAYLNFASGTGGVYPWTLATGAMSAYDGVNAELYRYLQNSKTARYGIIPMDYPEYPANSVIPLLISQNF